MQLLWKKMQQIFFNFKREKLLFPSLCSNYPILVSYYLVKSYLFMLFVLIWSWAGKFWKSGVWTPTPKGQKKICPFSVHFQILHKNLHIFVSNLFLTSFFTNQMSIKTNIFGMFPKLSLLGVESLCGDCWFIPVDWGS